MLCKVISGDLLTGAAESYEFEKPNLPKSVADLEKQLTPELPTAVPIFPFCQVLELAKNAHKGLHVIIIVHICVGALIDVLGPDVEKQLFFVGDKTLFHLR